MSSKEIIDQRERMYKEYNKEDPHTSWVISPHTITMLLICIAIGTYVAWTRDESASTEINVKMGMWAVVTMFLIFSSLQMRDGIFYRPHPMFWRTIMGLAVLYLCILVFFLFQSVTDARNFLQKIDPRLGVPLPERSYADNCDLYTPDDPVSKFRNLWNTINDEFIIAHLLGWFGKALLLRDYWVCWIMSVSFEILEYTFQHMLPNFKECWWDHLILDILVCNWIGFSLGFRVIKFFQMKHYEFVDEYRWEILDNWKRMIYVVFLIIIISVIEVNAFFLKFVLWVPPPHSFNVIRLLVWWGVGMPGVREYYHFITDKKCKKLGPMAWLCVALCCCETLICFKFGRGMFPLDHPKEVIYPWTAFVVLFILWFVCYYGIYKRRKSSTKSDPKTSTSSQQFLVKDSPQISAAENGKKKKKAKDQ